MISPRLCVWLIIILVSFIKPSYADIGVCNFSRGSGHTFDEIATNCQNGDTAFYSLSAESSNIKRLQDISRAFFDDTYFIVNFCDLNNKIIEGENDLGDMGTTYFVICTFQSKVERTP